MAAKFDVELTISSAKDLKNVNWRHGHLKPYAVVWTDSANKLSTKVATESDNSFVWEQKIVIPLAGRLDDDAVLSIDIVQADHEEDIKPLIGAARLKLHEVVDNVGFGDRFTRTLQLKRPSGRPQGKIDVKVIIRENRYHAPPPQYPPSYGVPVHGGGSDYYAQPPTSYGQPYGGPPATAPYGPHYGVHVPAPAPAPSPYPIQPPAGYPGSVYNATPTQYGQPSYEQGAGRAYAPEEKKKNKFGGMGTGIALGALGTVLGGIAIHEGLEHTAERAAEKVEASHHRCDYDTLDYDDY